MSEVGEFRVSFNFKKEEEEEEETKSH